MAALFKTTGSTSMEVKDRGGGGGRDGSSGSGVWDCGSTSTVVKMRRGSGEGGRSGGGASRGRLVRFCGAEGAWDSVR